MQQETAKHQVHMLWVYAFSFYFSFLIRSLTTLDCRLANWRRTAGTEYRRNSINVHCSATEVATTNQGQQQDRSKPMRARLQCSRKRLTTTQTIRKIIVLVTTFQNMRAGQRNVHRDVDLQARRFSEPSQDDCDSWQLPPRRANSQTVVVTRYIDNRKFET